MSTSQSINVLKVASLLVGLASALLFAALAGSLTIAFWQMPELTDYSGGFIRVIPSDGAAFGIASVVLVVLAFFFGRFSIRSGLRLWARVATLSVVLIALTVALYAFIGLGLFDRLGA
jgi:hypothetical protein